MSTLPLRIPPRRRAPLTPLGTTAGGLARGERIIEVHEPARPVVPVASPRARLGIAPRAAAWMMRGCDALAALIGLMVVQGGANQVDLLPAVALPVVWTLLVALTRADEPRTAHLDLEDVRRFGRAGAGLAVLGWAWLSLTRPSTPSLDVVSLAVVTTAVTVAVRLLVVRGLAGRLPLLRGSLTRVVLVGHLGEVSDVLAALRRTRDHGFDVVAACVPAVPPRSAPGHFAEAPCDVPLAIGVDGLGEVVEEHRAHAVITLPGAALRACELRHIAWLLETSGRQLFVGAGLLDVDLTRTTLTQAGGIPLVHVRHTELNGARRVTKEVLERLLATIALVLVTPLLLCLAAAVRLDSPGPALFRQVRIGRDGRPFSMLKLRTMTTDAETRRDRLQDQNEGAGLLFKMRADPRITRVGRVLRTYSLDELPQLLNIVRGEMSLVGPRPPLPGEAAHYDGDTRRRLAVKPGLTGLWQVSGRSDLPWEESVRLDLSYVENWSLAKDLRIVCRTVGAVLAHRGAY